MAWFSFHGRAAGTSTGNWLCRKAGSRNDQTNSILRISRRRPVARWPCPRKPSKAKKPFAFQNHPCRPHLLECRFAARSEQKDFLCLLTVPGPSFAVPPTALGAYALFVLNSRGTANQGRNIGSPKTTGAFPARQNDRAQDSLLGPKCQCTCATVESFRRGTSGQDAICLCSPG